MRNIMSVEIVTYSVDFLRIYVIYVYTHVFTWLKIIKYIFYMSSYKNCALTSSSVIKSVSFHHFVTNFCFRFCDPSRKLISDIRHDVIGVGLHYRINHGVVS